MQPNLQKYRDKVLRLLKYRPRSIAEIVRRLEKAGATPEEAQLVADDFIEMGLLDDREFAQWLIRSRTSGSKARGKFYISRELRSLGVSQDMSNELLSEVDPAQLVASAKAYLFKKEKLWQKYDQMGQKQRAYRLLASKGFSRDVITTAIDEWRVDQ